MKQRTLLREVSITGKGLHTGEEVFMALKPAPVDHGIIFKRTDLYGKPELTPSPDAVCDLIRSTTISSGHAKVHTIEHVLSALRGCGVDNAIIELNAPEPPIMDGSAKHFVNLIQEAEPVDQEKDREFFTLQEPVSVTSGNRSIIALPYDGLKITCTSADDRGIHTQHLSLDIDPEVFISEIAPARTFTIYEDIEALIKMGKIRGGSLDSAIVIKGNQIMSKEPLRFKDEFVRHKILDIIGDICLLGIPLKAHIIAVRPGHALNADLTKAIHEQYTAKKEGKKKQPSKKHSVAIDPSETDLDIERVLDIIPHRYPFVMVDRIIEFISDEELRAIKNVTFNEPYFQGHFPGKPVMPGVLQIEAMAQAAGILMLRKMPVSNKVAYFMSCDKVKFRSSVQPGDQIEIQVKLTKVKGRIGVAEGTCKVGGKVVSSAELMFMVVAPEEEPE